MTTLTFRPTATLADREAHRREGIDARYYHARTGTIATHEVLRDAGISDCVLPVITGTPVLVEVEDHTHERHDHGQFVASHQPTMGCVRLVFPSTAAYEAWVTSTSDMYDHAVIDA